MDRNAHDDLAVRHELVFTLRVGDAHQTFDDTVADFPDDAIHRRTSGAACSSARTGTNGRNP
jgi:hypothetical protein